ncbi:MAG: hypothetical protein QW424_03950 [Candidatus Bathyarchaeia archaeon]
MEEVVPVFQAYNRVLTEGVIFTVNMAFSVSHVDGYAPRTEDAVKAFIDNQSH